MRRKLKNLKHKSGHSENGAPRAILDLAFYRERQAASDVNTQRRFDSEYSGWSNPSRPRDQACVVRRPGDRQG